MNTVRVFGAIHSVAGAMASCGIAITTFTAEDTEQNAELKLASYSVHPVHPWFFRIYLLNKDRQDEQDKG
ncbi:MAG: hypothetical protein SGJ20_11085 [Planctomycetota bacterium]|nr:hypothetical protein [Planctomycetota bacterium]